MPTHTMQPAAVAGVSPAPAGLWERFSRFLRRFAEGTRGGLITMRLAAGQALRLHDAAGWTITCRSGNVWITQEGDGRDIFLKTGEEFALDRDGLAVICAAQSAVLSFRSREQEHG